MLIPQLLVKIVVQMQAKYRKEQIKTEGTYTIEKKVYGRQMTRRPTDGLASDELSAAELIPYVWPINGSMLACSHGSIPAYIRDLSPVYVAGYVTYA